MDMKGIPPLIGIRLCINSVYDNSHNASAIRCLPVPVSAECAMDLNIHSCSIEQQEPEPEDTLLLMHHGNCATENMCRMCFSSVIS